MIATTCRKCRKPLFTPGARPLHRTKMRCSCGWVQMIRPSQTFSEARASESKAIADEKAIEKIVASPLHSE